MSKQRDLPKSLQPPADSGTPVVIPDDAGVAVGYKPTASPAEPGESPVQPDAPAEAVAVARQPEDSLPELPAGSTRLSSGIVRTDAGGVQISSRPDNGVPFTFPGVPSKVETLRKGIVRSTM